MEERVPEAPRPAQDPKDEMKAMMTTTRTGGVYIPPARLRMMQEQITDKNSKEYQRMAWEALKKSINGLINKVMQERQRDAEGVRTCNHLTDYLLSIR